VIDKFYQILLVFVRIHVERTAADPRHDVDEIHEKLPMSYFHAASSLTKSNGHEDCVDENVDNGNVPTDIEKLGLGEFCRL
jgi:hypothetical protein